MKTFFIILFNFSLLADNFYPRNIIQLDDEFTPTILVVEKSTQLLHIYENSNGAPQLKKTVKIATGKFRGDKSVEGDHKTPEGIYFFQEFLPQSTLLKRYNDYGKIYGPGAFTTNYPNTFDRIMNKSGGGIWLHSTDDNSRVTKGLDSRGCVVAKDMDILDLAKYITLKKTPIIIVNELFHLSSQSYQELSEELKSFFQSWLRSWRSKSIKDYIKHYSKELFSHPFKGNYSQYKSYKKAIFSKPDIPEINAEDVFILAFKNQAIIGFKQIYRSENINDSGFKTLYMIRNENLEYEIIQENWSSLDKINESNSYPNKEYFSFLLDQNQQSSQTVLDTVKKDSDSE